jgi:peptidoglycan/LPS O-acetylase OafA/YrhL
VQVAAERKINKESGRLPSLDGFRAVSIVLVVGWHLHHKSDVPGMQLFSAYTGTLGVQIFFVLSGFLITRLLLEEKAQTGSVSLKSFYARRALRIVPVYLAYLLVLALLSLTTGLHVSACQFATAITFTKNFGCQTWIDAHLWSLSVEEQFYLLWPPFLVCTTRRTAMAAALVLIVLFPALRVVAHIVPDPSFGGLLFYDNLMIGCLAAMGVQSAPESFDRCLLWHPTPCRTMAAFAMISMNVLQENYLIGILTVPFAYTIQAAGAAYLICSYAFNKTGMGFAILNARPIAYLGLLSYSIYIWQELFLSTPEDFGFRSSPLLTFPINIMLTLVVGMASYHLLESPLLRLRVKLRRIANNNKMALY